MEPDIQPTILIVDDEPLVRTVLGDIFEAQGFSVVLAVDAHEARELFNLFGDSLGLALIDYRMPDESGLDLGHAFRAQRPQLPLLLMSGQLQRAGTAEERDAIFDASISKPFHIPSLLGIVDSLLARRARAAAAAR